MIDPYEGINFSNRKAVILDKDGNIIYEKDVIFPDYFSDNAVNIVSSKYFHKSKDKEELDIRNMINRVSETISRWGFEQEYFDNEYPKDFDYKLKKYQMQQLFAFNSPVYFNVGVNDEVQASACFILSIEDNMESIANVGVIESKIFKKGSGSGMNISPVRSSKETVGNSNGTASGPISFLKVHDVFANVIRCITSDSYLFTNYGLLQINNIIDINQKPDVGFHKIDENIDISLLNSNYELERSSQIYCGDKEPLIKVKLSLTGLEIKGTKEHPLLVLNKNFEFLWKKLSEIEEDDYVSVARNMDMWSQEYPSFENFKPDLKFVRRSITYPKTINKYLARILGYLVADGHIDGVQNRICYGKNNKETVEDFCKCFEKVFNTDIRPNFSERIQPGCSVESYSIKMQWEGLFRFFNFIGLEAKGSKNKEIPWCILQSPKEIVVEYLKAYFESDSYIGGRVLNSGSASEKLAKQNQQILLNLGILATRKDVIREGRNYYQLNMLGDETQKFINKIGFLTDEKHNLFESIDNSRTNIDVVPYLVQNIKKKMIKHGGYYKCIDNVTRLIKFDIFNRTKNSFVSISKVIEKDILSKLEMIDINMYNTLKFILDQNIFLDKIKEIKNIDSDYVYDFTLPKTHSFIANGIINHNSGGSLRRSAKLVCLNIDHPDIEEFIDCKIYEEEKIKALVAAGIEPKKGCELSDEAFFQNTNISVTIPDEFMEKVLNNEGSWDTKLVTTGEKYKSYDARDLLVKIAERAWECADPGVQFSDNINKWNTCINDGRINSSNPCGEFLFLDNSSCNLASINLLKFITYNSETKQYEFNFELFKDVVETVITAQDIIIDGAVYPTDEITKNSHQYRPLGLGYTNLGATLMYLGLPYDSDEGRYIASQLTALLTGIAFKTSNKLCMFKGPFERFEDNKYAYYNVLNLHYENFNKIKRSYNNFSDDLTDLNESLWKEIIDLTEDNEPFRNAQVTLLAPTGCIVSESMILSNQGIIEIGSLLPKETLLTESVVLEDQKWSNQDINILQENSIQKSDKFYYNGYQETIKIVTEDGYELEGTKNHKIRVLKENGDYVWKELKEIYENDQVCIKLGGHETLLEDKEYIPLKVSKNHICNNKELITPILKEELAYLLGFYMGNGNTHNDGIRLTVGDTHKDVVEILEYCSKESFNIGITSSFKNIGKSSSYCVNNKNISDFFKLNNFEKDKGNYGEGALSAFIPNQILQSKTSVLCSFLSGLFDSDGTVNRQYNCSIVEYSSVSKKLITQMQTCLTYLGIMTVVDEIIPKSSFSKNRQNIHRLRIKSGVYVKIFEKKIGFQCLKKKEKLQFNLKESRGATIYGKDVWIDFRNNLPPRIGHKIRGNFSVRVHQGQGSLFWAQKMINLYPSLDYSKIGVFLKLGLNTSRVKIIEKNKNQTFDISVPTNNTYIVNNFISHNTISFFMDAQTTGVEPEFSHVKYKRLSNTDGGSITTVSTVTKMCLENLKYTPVEIDEIEGFIKENKPLKECTFLKDDHCCIFDTSSNINLDQVIHHDGHIKMLAAVQPFISGGISKTINLPNNTDVQEIFKCYLDCWRFGLKGVTVYRDGSKNYQPLSTTKQEEIDEIDDLVIENYEDINHNEKLIKNLYASLAMRKLPEERPAIVYKFDVGGVKGFLTCGLYEDGGLGEIFINISKEGSTLSGLLDCLATVVSISLQKAVPLKDIVDKMMWQKFEPYGFTSNKDIRTATSLVDFIFKYLGMKFLDEKDQLELGLITKEEINTSDVDKYFDDDKEVNNFNNRTLLNRFAGPSCNKCGSIMVRKGNCFLCMNCGSNNGACG